MGPRYPNVHVKVRSRNPLALISAIRIGLRQAGASHTEINRFSNEALEQDDPTSVQRVCQKWAAIEQTH